MKTREPNKGKGSIKRGPDRKERTNSKLKLLITRVYSFNRTLSPPLLCVIWKCTTHSFINYSVRLEGHHWDITSIKVTAMKE